MKFRENNNLAVLTTKFVFNSNSKINHVYHFNDGWWQFSGQETNLKDSDYLIVSLEEILKLDNTLLELENLESNWEASWNLSTSKWEFKPM